MNLRTLATALLTTATLFGPVTPAAAAEAPRPATIAETLRDHVVATMADAHVPGMVSAVVDADGVIVADAFGSADLGADRPMRLDTPLRVGSISKPVTAALALTLADAGVLDLDATVDHDLDIDLTDTHGSASTVRQLLQHRGGYPDAFVGTHHTDLSDASDLDDWIRAVPDRPLPAGVVPTYSSVGYTVAGAAIAGATATSFADAADQWLFGPLGMDRATFRQPAPSDVATGYRWGPDDYVPYPADVPDLVPGVGLVASATDIATFMTAVLDDDGPLPDATRAGLLTAQAPQPGMRATSTGLAEWRGDARATLYHEGNGIGTISRMDLLPDAGVGIFTSVNGEALSGIGDPSSQTSFVRDLHERLISTHFTGPDTLAATTSTGDRGLPTDRVAGWYVPTRIDPASPLRLEALVSPRRVRDLPGGVLIDGTRYQRREPGAYRNGPDTATFVDHEGATFAMFGGTASYRRARSWETPPVAIAMLGGALLVLVTGLASAVRRSGGVHRWLAAGTGLLAVTFVVSLAFGVATVDAMTLFTGLPPAIRLAQFAVGGVVVTSVAMAAILLARSRSGVPLRDVVPSAAVSAAGITIGCWAWLWHILPM